MNPTPGVDIAVAATGAAAPPRCPTRTPRCDLRETAPPCAAHPRVRQSPRWSAAKRAPANRCSPPDTTRVVATRAHRPSADSQRRSSTDASCHPSCESSRAETWQPIIHFTPPMKTTKVFTTAAFDSNTTSAPMSNSHLRSATPAKSRKRETNPPSWARIDQQAFEIVWLFPHPKFPSPFTMVPSLNMVGDGTP